MTSGLDSGKADNLEGLARLYRSALAEYLADAGEAALRRANELGRRAIAEGAGVLELAAIHRDSLLALRDPAQAADGEPPAIARAFDFFVNGLAAYETWLAGIRQEREEAERASRAKNEFLAMLSHELRNPLMPVMGWIRVLKKHPLILDDRTLSEGVQALERNTQAIARLVDDCLDLARIAQGKIRLDRELADLNPILRATSEALRETARAKQIQVQVNPWQTPLWVRGDPHRLRQVVMNLLVNAIHYTAPEGRISARCFRIESQAEIQVTDNGAGIDPGALEQIFEPYRQNIDAWRSSQSGLGLGLAISRSIVDLHHGRIWAESQGLGRGSTFRVRLPLAVPDLSRKEVVPAWPPPDRPPTSLRILIIDDAPDLLALMKMELEALGYRVLTAAGGAPGLAMARERKPDLIISDIRMPGLDGYQFIRDIRTTAGLSRTPAIALTGFGMQGDIQKLLAAGFDACIRKPAEIEEICALIQKLTAATKTVKP